MSADCIFCKIVAKEIPGDVVYADEYVTAFRDIQPVAPTHVLIVPNKHIPSVNELTEEDAYLLGKMNLAAQQIAKTEGVAERSTPTRRSQTTHASAVRSPATLIVSAPSTRTSLAASSHSPT